MFVTNWISTTKIQKISEITNFFRHYFLSRTEVYLLIPTSNHNEWCGYYTCRQLYIFWFLHQTTTNSRNRQFNIGCISFDSYIKPQLLMYSAQIVQVVYLLIPTSNHNQAVDGLGSPELYIFWFLHQTTTIHIDDRALQCCISFDSYIKPQLCQSF